jgi:hypothetical protein
MSFSNQFSLSVELTRLLPAAGVAAATAGAALMNTARYLRTSGSDIVVEEDVASISARNMIEPGLEHRFRGAVTEVGNFEILAKLLPITLRSGPGPTVQRALKYPHYLPIVI